MSWPKYKNDADADRNPLHGDLDDYPDDFKFGGYDDRNYYDKDFGKPEPKKSNNMARYSGGNNSGNNRNYSSNNRKNNNQPEKKKSGCKMGFAKGDPKRPYIRGWKADKTHGLRAFIAGPAKNTKVHISKTSGREWENWTVKVTTPHGIELFNCLYDVRDKKVLIKDLGLVMNPKGGVGGYVGPYFIRKNK